eukprot:CAMPEP_0114318200 /NCGR_PEP_ID=MMETSP0059-20121206/24419_1 /TAXON_ID=36894 /ORGANISM="Pyramimonas parkeae, Strain CCMP726" /LENGTH=94 /DNA_ID=CAMNT_0001444801 /DNA_START=6 /DNA_END=287 /DNA_ORIENTATION=-
MKLVKQWAMGVEDTSTATKKSRGCDVKYLTQWSFDQKAFEGCVYNTKEFHKLIQTLPTGNPINMPFGFWIKHYPNWSYFLKFRHYSLQHALIVA